MRRTTIVICLAALLACGLLLVAPTYMVRAGSALRQANSAAVSSAGGSLTLSTWVRYSVIGRQGRQTVYARLVDERGMGVANASASMVVHTNDGATRYVAPPTDRRGYTRCSFAIGESARGCPVLVSVMAESRGRTAQATTCYRVWW